MWGNKNTTIDMNIQTEVTNTNIYRTLNLKNKQ